MKHNIRNNNMLLTLLLLVTAMVMPVTGNAQVTLTYDSSSSGYFNETASNLFDGDTSTKWCYDAPYPSSSAWVVFKANEACRLKGYTITTANDNSSNRDRNPKDWKIYGSNDKSNWTELVSVSNDSKLQDEDFTPYEYTLATAIDTQYEYYKWEITANQGADVFQVSEFSIAVSQCTETEHEGTLLLKEQRDATCIKVGYTQDFYQCSSCGRCYSDADGTSEIDLASVTIPTTEHIFNGENDDCSMCGLSHMFSYAGTSDDPFWISNADDLYWFAAWVNGTYTPAEGETAVTHLDACAFLANDITVNTGVLTADGTLASDVSGFRVWTPIGNSSNKYNGIFDGLRHTVSGLYFNNSAIECVGLFGYIVEDGKIFNVGVVDSYFNGSDHVGGVCGFIEGGEIRNCYYIGAVSGSFWVGGVCGRNNSGNINNCYITGAVSGFDNVGGVCGGTDFSTISNCYFDSEKCDRDAVGTNESGTVTNTEGKTTAQFVSGEVCYLLNGGVTDGSQAWYQTLASEGGDSYPVLKPNGNNTVYASQPCTSQFSNTEGIIVEHVLDQNGFCTKCSYSEPATLTTDKHDINGDGEKDEVYEIANAGQLYWFAALVNGTLTDGTAQNKAANAVLVNDITVNTGVLTAEGTLARDVSGFRVWTPIGNDSHPYLGTFDGQSHTVSGLYFNNSTTNYVGLFGFINIGGKISNVGVVDSYFRGNDYVGGVCGYHYSSSISNCYSAGAVSGTTYVGGVCGYNNSGNISNCYSAGAVSGNLGIGGVCGYNYSGNISNCYSAGAVSGNNYVGGVCGYNFKGTISNCYLDNEKCSTNAVGTNSNGTVTSTEGKTTAQFASGEVCYLLNGSKSDGTQAWYQNLAAEGRDAYPVLTSNGNNTVYDASLLCGGINNVGNTYANTETVSIEHILTGEPSFNEEKSIYQGICQREGCGTCYFADSKGLYAAEEEAGAFTANTYVLQDATPYDNRAVFTVNDFTYARTFEDTGWTTWYVPFDLVLTEELCNTYSFSRINNVHRYDDNDDGTPDRTEVEAFNQLAGVTLKANYPYLVKAKTDGNLHMDLMLNGVTPAKAEDNGCFCQSVDYKYSFTGTYSGLSEVGTGSEDPYSLQSNGEWTHQSEISPMRHYLTVTSRNAAPLNSLARISLVVIGDETLTGTVIPYSQEKRQTETYDLSGRLTHSNQRGIVIRNGKKIIQK